MYFQGRIITALTKPVFIYNTDFIITNKSV